MSIWRWADRLDPVPESARVTLGEGNTPLARSRRLGPEVGLRRLSFKLDFAGPTGSYKDRFAAAAVSHMVAAGQTLCVGTSSGNTGSALAAYCAAARIRCVIGIVETAPEGKLQQMLAYGATLFRVKGFGIDPAVTAGTMDTVQRLGRRPGAAVQVSAYHYSPKGMDGVRTLAYELADQLSGGIGHVFSPGGGGGMALAVARGFADLVRDDVIPKTPAVDLVQPAGNDTIAGALRDGATEAREVAVCTSRISGLQVPNVIDGHIAVRELRATGGSGHLVTDEEVWETQRRLAREEGIFCEPAGAVSVAGALKAAREGRLDPDAEVVCLITGSGFKDPPSVAKMLEGTSAPVVTMEEFAERAAG